MKMSSIQFRGNIGFIVFILIIIVAFMFCGNYLSSDFENKNRLMEEEVGKISNVNIEVLTNEEKSLKNQNDELAMQIDKLKKEVVTKFDKDLFYSTLSTFADINNLSLSNFKQGELLSEEEGFYSVDYDITMEGSIYGMMEFFNLIKQMGGQYTINYFSFRQDGSYSWLSREVENEETLGFVTDIKDGVTEDSLKEIIELNNKVESNNYPKGEKKPDKVVKEVTDTAKNWLGDLLASEIEVIEDNTQHNKEQEKIDEESKIQREEDKKSIETFLKENYPEGTIIKNGQIIVPMVEGNMIFDLGITFVGNASGNVVNSNLDEFLIPHLTNTSIEKTIPINWDGKEVLIPSIIESVDVSDLSNITIDAKSTFIVSWNNDYLSRSIIETYLNGREDGGYGELTKVAAEIRFLQKNGKTDLDIIKYLIFLYQYLSVKGIIN